MPGMPFWSTNRGMCVRGKLGRAGTLALVGGRTAPRMGLTRRKPLTVPHQRCTIIELGLLGRNESAMLPVTFVVDGESGWPDGSLPQSLNRLTTNRAYLGGSFASRQAVSGAGASGSMVRALVTRDYSRNCQLKTLCGGILYGHSTLRGL